MNKLFCLSLLFLMFACQKEDSEPLPDGNISIVGEIKSYVKRFEEEANKHNVVADVSNLIISTTEGLIEGQYCGLAYSSYKETGRPKIFISRKCWIDKSDYYKEELVFHELGHAILKRSHDHSLLPDGSSKTMMFPGRAQYSLSGENWKRAYYLAELFNPHEPVPDWAKTYLKTDSVLLLQDAIESVNTAWVPSDTAAFVMYVDSVDYESAPYSLSIISNEIQEMKSAKFQYTISNLELQDSCSVQLNLSVLRESMEKKVTVRLFFYKGTKSWNAYKELNYSKSVFAGSQVNDVNRYEFITEKFASFDQVKISLEWDAKQTGKVSFDDIELYALTERLAYYDEE